MVRPGQPLFIPFLSFHIIPTATITVGTITILSRYCVHPLHWYNPCDIHVHISSTEFLFVKMRFCFGESKVLSVCVQGCFQIQDNNKFAKGLPSSHQTLGEPQQHPDVHYFEGMKTFVWCTSPGTRKQTFTCMNHVRWQLQIFDQ